MLVAKSLATKFRLRENLQAKYFTSENIPIYDNYIQISAQSSEDIIILLLPTELALLSNL